MSEQGETSIWKKEITLRRKPKPEKPAAESAKAAETSIWKKELSFRSKPKQKPAPQPSAQAPRPTETSVWKKEISVRRKPKEKPAPQPKAEAPQPAETSVWKKEISFRRKPKPKAEPLVRPAAEVAKPAETSVWKKEISFRRKPKATVKAEPLVSAPPAEPVPPPAVPEVEEPKPLPEETTQPFELPAEPIALPPVTGPTLEPDPGPAAPSLPPVFPAVPVSAPPSAAEDVPTEPAPGSLPPVSAYVPAPAEVPPPAAPEPEPQPELEPAAVVPEPTVTTPEEDAPTPAPEPSPAPSRSERREAKKAADQLAKRNRQRAKELAKEERKSARHKHARVVGLKIGASQVAAAYVVNKGGPRLVRTARASLPHGVVVGGELREPDELATVLKTLFRKNKLPQTVVRLGIANNRIGVRTFEISGVEDDAQLANAVRFRAQEALPIPLDEAVLDYRILDDRVGEDGVRVCRVLLVVAHRELVERYVAACRKAGLKLIGIDLEAFGLLRALTDPANPPASDAAVVCVAIGHDRSTLAVSDGRVCEFTRVLSWGGSDLDVALARTLDLTPAAAEPVKRELMLGEAGEAAGLDAHQADEARAAMVGELRSFARELVGSLRFYQDQPNSLGIGEIMITGGASAAGGLAAELGRLIGIPVRVADPLSRIRVPRKQRNQNGSVGSLAVAVGLGIED
jgi:type IV pilus assembly protein PilM